MYSSTSTMVQSQSHHLCTEQFWEEVSWSTWYKLLLLLQFASLSFRSALDLLQLWVHNYAFFPFMSINSKSFSWKSSNWNCLLLCNTLKMWDLTTTSVASTEISGKSPLKSISDSFRVNEGGGRSPEKRLLSFSVM